MPFVFVQMALDDLWRSYRFDVTLFWFRAGWSRVSNREIFGWAFSGQAKASLVGAGFLFIGCGTGLAEVAINADEASVGKISGSSLCIDYIPYHQIYPSTVASPLIAH